jgi:hypothetical protein
MTRHAQRNSGVRLSRPRQRVLYAVIGAVWATGILWLVFHYYLSRQGPFGVEPHPLEVWWLRLHGAAAFVTLWFGGLLWVVHLRPGLKQASWRKSGILLLVVFGALVASGYLLYYGGGDAVRDWVALLHWLIGTLLVVPLLIHVLRARRFRVVVPERR